jgi:hypothetical protein
VACRLQGQAYGTLSLLVSSIYTIIILLPCIFRNLAATQALKVQCSAYQKYSSKVEAQAVYDWALLRGKVQTL